MKLTQGKLIETIRRKNQGWTTYQARKIAGISIRRVNQVYGQYLVSGEIPEIGIKNGRPKRTLKKSLFPKKVIFSKFSIGFVVYVETGGYDLGLHFERKERKGIYCQIFV